MVLVFVGSSVCIKKWLQFPHPEQHSVTGPVLEVLDENEDGCVGEEMRSRSRAAMKSGMCLPFK